MQRIYLGKPNEKYLGLPDINGREVFTLVPLGILVVILGVYPRPVLDLIDRSLGNLNQIVLTAGKVAQATPALIP